MQVQREWPSDLNACKDKFLVQSVVSGGQTDFTELFAKGKEDIKEAKLRVAYVQPAPPPSPVPEDEEEKGDGDAPGDLPEPAPAPGPSLQRMFTAKPAFEAPPAEKAAPLKAAKDDGATEAAQERARLQRRVEELTSKNDSLQADLKMALANKPDPSAAARGFSLLHLLITGVYTQHHPIPARPAIPYTIYFDRIRSKKRTMFQRFGNTDNFWVWFVYFNTGSSCTLFFFIEGWCSYFFFLPTLLSCVMQRYLHLPSGSTITS